MEMNSSIKSD